MISAAARVFRADRQRRRAPEKWSLLYPDPRTSVLSPAYDFVATLPYISRELALSFGDTRSLSEITQGQVRRLADSARPQATCGRLLPMSRIGPSLHGRRLRKRTLLLEKMSTAIGEQILAVAKTLANVRWSFRETAAQVGVTIFIRFVVPIS